MATKKIKSIKLSKEEIEFLSESNKIEREYSQEALEDAKLAWEYALKNKRKLTQKSGIKYILKMHKILLEKLAPHYAGVIRECPVMIGGEIRSQSKEEITAGLWDLLREWENYRPCKDQEKFLKEWHIHFEYIHPFSDGNGRTGRILMNIQRLELGLPILIIYEIDKYRYYEWFSK